MSSQFNAGDILWPSNFSWAPPISHQNIAPIASNIRVHCGFPCAYIQVWWWVSVQTKTYSVTYGATMYYRDLTRAAPIVQREIDLVHTAATGDALTVYLWWMTRVAHRNTEYIPGRYVPPLS